MSEIRTFLARHSLLAGLVLMFALTWPIDLAQAGLLPFEVPFAAYLFLGWGFILAAIFMTGVTQGRQGIKSLLKRYLIWRVGCRWYGVALALYPLLFAAALGLGVSLGLAELDFSQTLAAQFFGPQTAWPLFVVPFFLFEAISNGEEMGWRGYVLPRVQARHNALAAALIVGVIWGMWHLPKFLAPFDGALFALTLVKSMADSVLYTWLNNNTRGSLLLVTLFHAAGNTAGFFLLPAGGDDKVALLAIITALVMLSAVVVVVHSGPQRLSRAAGQASDALELIDSAAVVQLDQVNTLQR